MVQINQQFLDALFRFKLSECICSLKRELYLVLFFTLTLVFHLLESHLWVFYFLSYKTKVQKQLKRKDSVLFYTLFEFLVEKIYSPL